MVISSRAARWGALLVSLICVFSLVFITGLRAAPLPGPTLESLESDVQSAVAEYLQAETDAATAQEELNALNTRLNEFLVDLSEFADQRLPQLDDALGYVTEDDREQFGARWHKTISQYMLVIEQVTKDPVVASELEGFRETFVQMLSDYLGALAHSQDAQVRMESAALEATLILSSRYDIDAAQARDSLAHGTLDSLLTDLYAAQNPEEAGQVQYDVGKADDGAADGGDAQAPGLQDALHRTGQRHHALGVQGGAEQRLAEPLDDLGLDHGDLLVGEVCQDLHGGCPCQAPASREAGCGS